MSECIPLSLDKNTPESIIDIILSNSVLEHIPNKDFLFIFENLYKISRINGYFLHAVDFGSHGVEGDGFGMLYDHPRQEAGMRSLNFLRKPEIEESLRTAGFKCERVVYRQAKVDMKNIHSYWRKYWEDDLTSRAVFFFGRK